MECFFTTFCWTAFPHTSLNHGLAFPRPLSDNSGVASRGKLRGGYNVPRPKVQIDADQQLCNAKSLLFSTFLGGYLSTFWSFGTHFLQRPHSERQRMTRFFLSIQLLYKRGKYFFKLCFAMILPLYFIDFYGKRAASYSSNSYQVISM